MREPAFWWREAGLAAGLLAPLAAVYGAVASARLAQRGARAAVPVICIGNLTLGGAGKTPLVLTLARLLRDAGEQPVLLSRGYGGRLEGPLRVDLARHRAADVGDEPLLLARIAPTVVARDRAKGALAAIAAGASVIVMDDGFQNPSLQ
jgi:tetraacyldisaccharide 4'-kinase